MSDETEKPCTCSLKGDPYKAPEQHAIGCPWREEHPASAAVTEKGSR